MPIPGKSHAQLGIPLDLLAQLALQIVGNIDFTFFSMARRVVGSGTVLKTSRLTWGTLRQYPRRPP